MQHDLRNFKQWSNWLQNVIQTKPDIWPGIWSVFDSCIFFSWILTWRRPWISSALSCDIQTLTVIYDDLMVISDVFVKLSQEEKHFERNGIDHGRPWGTQFTFVSLYSTTITRCHSGELRRSLQWRHNERDGVSNHQPHDCLPNRLFRRRLKKTSKLRVTGLCAGNSPVTRELPAQRASKAENFSIWSRHHAILSDLSLFKSDPS